MQSFTGPLPHVSNCSYNGAPLRSNSINSRSACIAFSPRYLSKGPLTESTTLRTVGSALSNQSCAAPLLQNSLPFLSISHITVSLAAITFAADFVACHSSAAIRSFEITTLRAQQFHALKVRYRNQYLFDKWIICLKGLQGEVNLQHVMLICTNMQRHYGPQHKTRISNTHLRQPWATGSNRNCSETKPGFECF